MRWFHHDTDTRDDDKIFELGDRFGLQGYGFFWVVLEECYAADAEGFQIEVTETWCRKISKYFGVTDSRVITRLLDGLADLGLIDKQMWQEQIIFVPSIQKRADSYMKKRTDAAARKRKQRAKTSASQESSHNVTQVSRVTPGDNGDVTPADIQIDLKDLDQERNISLGDRAKKTEGDKSPSTRKGSRNKKAVPEKYPAEFSAWWRKYYEFCQAISSDEKLVNAGNKTEAFTAWQKLFPDDQPTADFLEGDEFYRKSKVAEFRKKGEAQGISHGCRYLGAGDDAPKWKQALDFSRRKSGKNMPEMSADPQVKTMWADFKKAAAKYGHTVEEAPDLPGRFLLDKKIERLESEVLQELLEIWRLA